MLYVAILMSLVATALAAPRYPSAYRNYQACYPQGTPRYGNKWCKFSNHQAEVGSVCWFSCIEGYHLRGESVTKCILDQFTGIPQYNVTFGICQPNAPVLTEGKNGPFLLHAYDPSSFVIHVSMSTEVTLKSYYYLSIYVESPGLNGVKNTVSFRVQGFEGRYIKANASHVYTDNYALGNPAEKDRATFWLRSDKFYNGYSAFESYVKKDHFIVHKSRKIKLAKVENAEDRVLASFIWRNTDL